MTKQYLTGITVLLTLTFFFSCGSSGTQMEEGGQIVFMVASDMGRRDESEQRNIAGIMGRYAEQDSIDFLIVAGDPIHDEGVQSVEDPEWEAKIESIYTHSALELPWWVVSGNHEYRGNVQAILDYSGVTERWNAPERYYSFEREIPGSGLQCLFVMIDTPPLIDKYRENEKYSDAGEQDLDKQLYWLDSVLVHSDAHWKIVTGHHPVYAYTEKADSERENMQKRVGSILEDREADLYICGHIHSFQHLKPENNRVNYIVNSSASQSRKAQPVDGTLFCSGDPGFSVFTVTADRIAVKFINHRGEEIYTTVIVPEIKNNHSPHPIPK